MNKYRSHFFYLHLLSFISMLLAVFLAIMYIYYSITRGGTQIYICAAVWSIIVVWDIIWFRRRLAERKMEE